MRHSSISRDRRRRGGKRRRKRRRKTARGKKLKDLGERREGEGEGFPSKETVV